MKNNYHYEERLHIEEATTRILRYNAIMRFPMDEEFYKCEAFLEYITTEDQKRLNDLEDIIGSAAEQAVNDDPDILFKKNNKDVMKRQLIDVCKAGRNEYNYISGKYGEGHKAKKIYDQKNQEIGIIRKATYIERAKKVLKEVPVKILKKGISNAVTAGITAAMIKGGALGATIAGGTVTIAGFTVGAPLLIGVAVAACLTLATKAVVHLTPPETKKKIREKIHEYSESTICTIQRESEAIRKSEIFQTCIEPVVEKVKPFYEKAKDYAQEKWEKVKEYREKAKKFVKSIVPW